MHTYRLSRSGRRTTLILLVGALMIWAFALWTLRSTLNISYNPFLFVSSLQTTLAQGLTVAQVVPAILMIVLIVATPLVIWNLLEEWAASFTPTEQGLQFESLGVRLVYPWSGLVGVRRVDDDDDEPIDELLFDADYTRAIANPLVRFLHGQAYGRTKLPIYAGLEERDALLQVIAERAGQAFQGPDGNALQSAPEPAPSSGSPIV